jgi:hypothetical protein
MANFDHFVFTTLASEKYLNIQFAEWKRFGEKNDIYMA